MKSILEEIWYGNVYPSDDCHRLSKEGRELAGHLADHHEKLLETLTDKQKEMLEKFLDSHSELSSINEREIFIYAFRLGARIAFEVMSMDAE